MVFLVMILVIVGTILGWFVSEFQTRRWIRLLLGTCAVTAGLYAGILYGQFKVLQAKVHFGEATYRLLQVTLDEIGNGNTDRAAAELTLLRRDLVDTYLRKNECTELIEATVARMELHTNKEP